MSFTLPRRAALAGAAALTGFPRLGFTQPRQPIKVGVPTILSGRVAQLGISSRNAMQIEVDRFNAEGGLDGRPIELVVRDSRGTPAEAAAGTARKVRNLNGGKTPAASVLNFGGRGHELWCPGGEVAFVRSLIVQSA